MKKILTIISAVLVFLCFGATAFAANGSFTSSPSANKAPVLVEYDNETPECTATIVVCAYADRHTLDDAAKANLEAAYATIASTSDLGTLGYGVKTMANSLNVTTNHLYVRDLFEISYEDCVGHEDHANFTITVKPSSVMNYAGILHYDNGVWELVESTVTKDGEITIQVDDLSPFAIVVHDGSVGAGNASNQVGILSEKELKLFAAIFVAVSLFGILIVTNKMRNA